MPKGPGVDVNDPRLYLQYNEVRIILPAAASKGARLLTREFVVHRVRRLADPAALSVDGQDAVSACVPAAPALPTRPPWFP